FERVLDELKEKKILTSEITEKIVNIFFMEQFLKAMEKLSLNQVQKYIFQPSGRIMWTVGGLEHDYLIFPRKFCSCMDFYLQGISKSVQYYCKHLIAQAIFENLDESNVKKGENITEDDKYHGILKKIFKINL
ncbi:MAG: hypothetical protein GY870_05950, partial [archaeon]|nr:hypothetical protein [archaeon]